jgi:hypothetical protein
MLLGLKDKMPFGKHKGEFIKDVIKSDFQYLYWACENITGFALTTKAQEALPDKKEIVLYRKAKRACSDMGGLGRLLNSGPSGEYAQLSMDTGPLFEDTEEDY